MSVVSVLWKPIAVCRLAHDARVPAWALDGEFLSIQRDEDALNVICDGDSAPKGLSGVERNWRAVRFSFDEELSPGEAMATVARAISAAGVHAIDAGEGMLLVRAPELREAVVALERAGFTVEV